MERNDRLPAIPLICMDPYLSIWMPADTMTATDTAHWSGVPKPIRGMIHVDGTRARYLGLGNGNDAEHIGIEVTPTRTRFSSSYKGIRIDTTFTTPALPDDLDLMSMPVTLVSWKLTVMDGQPHEVKLDLNLSASLCYSGEVPPRMIGQNFSSDGVNTALCGQLTQKPLCHSGDHITIDWGYLYLTSDAQTKGGEHGVSLNWTGKVEGETEIHAVIAYDDIASINYFGDLCKPWYRRNGAQITDAIKLAWTQFDSIIDRCVKLDERVTADAAKISEDYVTIVNAAWRHTICAHKLIATPKGEMALLSKENDSNGCIGTVDLSYPSMPIFLKYCPELVNAMCRPVLEFANMPVWTHDFSPHDVGRYPYATGQVYAARCGYSIYNGCTHPPYYLYPASAEVYDFKYQMPVEESGNMLVLLYAAQVYGADKKLAEDYRTTLDKWVKYLVEYGEDPGEQLCTDDFAGHLAHNVNLAAKAIVGVACYGRLIGDPAWEQKAKEMAGRLLEKIGGEGNTPLTLEGKGWSQKYNLLWDKVLSLGLLPESFYEAELRSYLPRINKYGLPLDSRSDYTKSDWICWCAAMADDPEVRSALLAPIARTIRETESRVPFSDWYNTKTGHYVHFIARSVQGGVFAPMLTVKD